MEAEEKKIDIPKMWQRIGFSASMDSRSKKEMKEVYGLSPFKFKNYMDYHIRLTNFNRGYRRGKQELFDIVPAAKSADHQNIINDRFKDLGIAA